MNIFFKSYGYSERMQETVRPGIIDVLWEVTF